MYDRDEVIRQAAIAARQQAAGVDRALAEYLREGDERAEALLRCELVALSSGYEVGEHDGSTRTAREAAATAALLAWDGPQLEQATYERLQIRAARAVWMSLWGVVAYTDGSVGQVSSEWHELLALGVHATGKRDDGAVLWAQAEKQRRREAQGLIAGEISLAQAIERLASELGSESAQAFVERLPERLKPYVRKVLDRGGY